MSIGTDIHSHILPAIDDGSQSVEMSLDILRGLESLGYTRIWTTPHISYLYPNDKNTIRAAFDSVEEAAGEAGINIELHYAAEYMFDDNFVNNLYKQDDLLTLPNKHLIIEFSMQSEPIIFYKDILFDLQMRGYRLILAHPERYLYFHNSFSIYEELKRSGILFQVNLLSLSGYYGKPIKKMAEKFVKRYMIDLLGTDIHHPDQLKLLQQPKLIKTVNNIRYKNDFPDFI